VATAAGFCTAIATWNSAVLAAEKRTDDDVTQRAFFKGSGTGPVAKFCVRAQDDRPSSDNVTDWLTLDRLYLLPSALSTPPDTPAAAEGAAAQSSSDVGGPIINTFAATIASADVREEFAQRTQVPNLIRTWRFDNVPAGSAHQLRIEGSTSGETFRFLYATEGSGGNPGTFNNFVPNAEITSTTEGSADHTFPVAVSGKIWIRVVDTAPGTTAIVKIDQLLIKTTP
jgi:hypothetical protein